MGPTRPLSTTTRSVSSLSPFHETLSQDSDAFHLGYGHAQHQGACTTGLCAEGVFGMSSVCLDESVNVVRTWHFDLVWHVRVFSTKVVRACSYCAWVRSSSRTSWGPPPISRECSPHAATQVSDHSVEFVCNPFRSSKLRRIVIDFSVITTTWSPSRACPTVHAA